MKLPDVRPSTVVCLGSIDWTFNWQVPQEIVTGLAERGHRVLYIENTGVRRPGVRDLSRLVQRLGNWCRALGRVRPITDRCDVYSPVLLPFPYSRLACWINSRLLRRVVRRWVNGESEHPILFITFLPTPLARALSSALTPALVIYYCADRLAESSFAARSVREHERKLFAEAHVVFTTSQGLLETASRFTSHAVLLTSGVRFDEFCRDPAAECPAVLRNLHGPIVGYVGSLRNELDLELLVRVAQLAPDLTFALIGPLTTSVTGLAACPNVVLPGAVPHAEAVRCIRRFAVGLLPYRLNGYTSDLLPVKLKEYLAAGLPIVSTALPQVRQFVSEHGPVVTFADTAEGFVAAVRAALTRHSSQDVERRTRVARRYDWTHQMALMTGIIDATLDSRPPARRDSGQ